MSRSRLAYRHILIMLSFSNRFRLTTRSISSKLALRVPNRAASVSRASAADERGNNVVGGRRCFRSEKEKEEERLSWRSAPQYRRLRFVARVAFELRTLNAPLCRAFSSTLTRVVRPRIKRKRLCDFHERACTFFSPFDVWA